MSCVSVCTYTCTWLPTEKIWNLLLESTYRVAFFQLSPQVLLSVAGLSLPKSYRLAQCQMPREHPRLFFLEKFPVLASCRWLIIAEGAAGARSELLALEFLLFQQFYQVLWVYLPRRLMERHTTQLMFLKNDEGEKQSSQPETLPAGRVWSIQLLLLLLLPLSKNYAIQSFSQHVGGMICSPIFVARSAVVMARSSLIIIWSIVLPVSCISSFVFL